MKRALRACWIAGLLVFAAASLIWLGYRVYQIDLGRRVAASVQNGDLIFQTCKSAVGVVIRDATHSRYDHLGIVFSRSGGWYVLEAIEPVCITPLQDWVERGLLSQVALRRLQNPAPLRQPGAMARFRAVMKENLGKPYDYLLGWSDEREYCSELAWKVYRAAFGVTLAAPRHFADFDLSKASVRLYVQKLFHGRPPLGETVVSPQDLLQSDLLRDVPLR